MMSANNWTLIDNDMCSITVAHEMFVSVCVL